MIYPDTPSRSGGAGRYEKSMCPRSPVAMEVDLYGRKESRPFLLKCTLAYKLLNRDMQKGMC